MAAESYERRRAREPGGGVRDHDPGPRRAHRQAHGLRRPRSCWDPNQPDGQPRRCLDTSRAERLFGFRAQVALRGGPARGPSSGTEASAPRRLPRAERSPPRGGAAVLRGEPRGHRGVAAAPSLLLRLPGAGAPGAHPRRASGCSTSAAARATCSPPSSRPTAWASTSRPRRWRRRAAAYAGPQPPLLRGRRRRPPPAGPGRAGPST